MKGWECPKCGKCYAPFVKECESCNNTTTTTTIPITTAAPLVANVWCCFCGQVHMNYGPCPSRTFWRYY